MPITARLAAVAARGFGLFSAVARAVDPYFQYVTALLHGDGTNGAQNNTFLDSSTNNFTITRNGNTTQGSFSPFSQKGWSNYFGGASNYLSASDNAAFDLGAGDFTFECWAYTSSWSSQYNVLLSQWTADTAYIFRITSSLIGMYANIGGTQNYQATTTNTLNTWDHYAITRNGSTVTFWKNGISVGTSAISGTINNSTGNVTIAIIGDLNVNTAHIGYISNLRLIKGTAVYTSNFTPSTTPLTAISGTSLLTCQSNRFVDNSSNAFALTVTGTPSVQPISPFYATTAYSTASVGGSGYFDGSGDYLAYPNNTAFAFGTGAFTIEGWVNSNALNDKFILSGRAAIGTMHITYGGYGGSTVGCLRYVGSSTITSGSVVISNNAWNHFAIVRDGSNNITLYVNGVSTGTGTDTTNYTTTTGTWYINANDSGPTAGGEGYISNLRVVKGTAVYTAAFTPPTAPLTAITNTSLLLNCTNGGIYDNAAAADYETVGDAQVSTAVVKYGTGSMKFDGTGDYLYAKNTRLFDIGSGDFTVEGWVYPTTSGTTRAIVSQFNTNGTGPGWTIYLKTTNVLEFYGGSGTVTVTGTYAFPANTWTHFAVCRTASTINIFANGNLNGTATNSSFSDDTTGPVEVGARGGTGSIPFTGYIDDLRLTKGISRYPYNFTPPAAAFPNIGGTVTPTSDQYFNYTTLLLPGNGTNGAQNNTFLDSSTNAFTITRNGNTTQGNFSPFSQTGWGNYFDGTGDYLITTATQVIPSGSFTVETWVYPTSSSDSYAVAQGTTGNAGRFSLGITSSLWYVQIGATQVNAGSVTLNQWTHLAATFNGSTLTLYVNGTSVGTAATTTNAQNTTLRIGSLGPADWGTFYWTGYISNVRAANSVVYTSNFTPPTSALTAISGTSLLTCQSNRFVDNSTNAFAITRNGDVSVQAFSPFAPTAAWSATTNGGSGYFDGSGDYLTSSIGSIASGASFTFEFWAYYTGSLTANTRYFDLNSYAFAAQNLVYRVAGVSVGSGAVQVSMNGSQGASSNGVAKLNTWQHHAISYDGTTLSIWVDGTRVISYTPTAGALLTAIAIGSSSAAAEYFTGYISGFRLVIGSTVYTPSSSTITVPTSPPTAITNTSLLLNYTNGGIVDATAKNDLETVGNAQISTTQSKFGGSSMAFDGTGDYLSVNGGPGSNQRVGFGTSDFTIECWVYCTISGASNNGIYDCRYSASATGPTLYYIPSSGVIMFYNGANQITGSTLTINTWNHIALVRYSGVTKLYINGVQSGSSYTDTNNYTSGVNTGIVGGFYDGSASWNGYIDDFRITRGIARYTSNFTPPTSAFLTL